MNYNKVSLVEFYSELKLLFNNSKFNYTISSEKFLSSGNLISIIKECYPDVLINDLDYWLEWEEGNIEVSPQQFMESIFPIISDINDTPVILLFDDCFTCGFVFSLKLSYLFGFYESFLFAEPFCTLFQPFDHIFYFPAERRLLVVHHEGKFVDFSWP